MVLPVHVFETSQAAGAAIAERIVARLQAHPAAAPFLLGCPGGRTPRPIYSVLADRASKFGLDLSQLIIVMMDEYLEGPEGALQLAPSNAHYSCLGFAKREIRAVLNAGLPGRRQIPERNVRMPDPADPGAYDTMIQEAGGIDLFILASGAGDGHVAFNPPGAPSDSGTRVVRLAEQTRRDNLRTFPQFAGIEEVPRYGVTVGIGTIAEWSKEAAMLLCGKDKKPAFDHITAAAGYDPQWPATVVAACAKAAIYADRAAAGTA